MVAGDEEFVGVRVEPGEGVIEFIVCARLGEFTCVDENVALWEMRLSVVGHRGCSSCVSDMQTRRMGSLLEVLEALEATEGAA